MAGLINTNVISQVCIIVKNIEKTKKKWADFFGVPVPPTMNGGDFEITQTRYRKKPAPKANCLMAFFDAGNIQMELIEPNGKKSVWRDFLDEHGEGIHHIAFQVEGMEKVLENCKQSGLKCTQWGKYGDGGGEYAYLDSEKDFKCVIELLENYKK
jgi:methylmalonyl-CoA epimerase